MEDKILISNQIFDQASNNMRKYFPDFKVSPILVGNLQATVWDLMDTVDHKTLSLLVFSSYMGYIIGVQDTRLAMT